MPSIAGQMAMAEAFTANFLASRALMIPGRAYQTCQTMIGSLWGVAGTEHGSPERAPGLADSRQEASGTRLCVC